MSTLIQNLDLEIQTPKAKSFTWVHISDLHFSHCGSAKSQVDQKLVSTQILRDAKEVAKKIGPPDAVFLTGDIAFQANMANEYLPASEWISKLMNELHISSSNIYMVPGNHDVDRAQVYSKLGCRLIHEHLRKNPNVIDELFKVPDELHQIWPKLENYSDFADKYGSPKLSHENPFWCVTINSAIGKLCLIGLNTVLLSYDNQDAPLNLALGLSQIHRAVMLQPEDALLIILQHHPPEWLEDGGELERFLLRRPHILFCGHTHKQAGLITSPLHGSGLIRFVAGAGHSNGMSFTEHAYSWGRISAKGLEYLPRKWVQQYGEFRADRNGHDLMNPEGVVPLNRDQLPTLLSEWLPKPEPIFIAGVVQWINDPKGQWRLTLKGELADFDKKKIDDLLQKIREISGDINVSLDFVCDGSVTCILRGSDKGFDKLKSIFDYEPTRLNLELGHDVLSLARVNGATLKATMEVSDGNEKPEFVDQNLITTRGLSMTSPNLTWVVTNRNNPFSYDLIIDKGPAGEENDKLRKYSIAGQDINKLNEKDDRWNKTLFEDANRIRDYFKAALNISEENWWVNLSAYESKRMLPAPLARTEMGRDLLAQDCVLKRLSAALIHPDHQIGRLFWDNVAKECGVLRGQKSVDISTFQKVWIEPEKALVFEGIVDSDIVMKNSLLAKHIGDNVGCIIESRLKVKCQEDSYAMDAQFNRSVTNAERQTQVNTQRTVAEIFQQIVVPEITWEINESDRFIRLRQIYHSLILATYLKSLKKENPKYREFIDINQPEKIGIAINTDLNDEYYNEYLQLFNYGLYRCSKKSLDLRSGKLIRHTYFAGAINFQNMLVEYCQLDAEKEIVQQLHVLGQQFRYASSPLVSLVVR